MKPTKTRKIQDEFTDLPVSRQRKHQLRQRKLLQKLIKDQKEQAQKGKDE